MHENTNWNLKGAKASFFGIIRQIPIRVFVIHKISSNAQNNQNRRRVEKRTYSGAVSYNEGEGDRGAIYV